MEKRTMGGLIAALRKANGMTQKELAERLHVSDKTVSRWERDEGTPDLAVIPVIAEIFGVSCDELLRGERRPPEEQTGEALPAEAGAKGEKQRRRLLKAALSRYRTQTSIAVGLSALGLIGALIANLAFLQARLGFFIGAMFFVVSLVCQAAFVNRALLSVEDAGLEADALSAFKRSVITLAQTSVGVTIALVGFTAPLLLVDAYRGLEAGSMMILGLIGAVVFLAVYGVAMIFVNNTLIKKGAYPLDEKQLERLHRLRRLKKRCAGRLLLVLVLTFAGQVFGAEMIWNMQQLAFGTTFYDYESFVEYMEQDIPPEGQYYSTGWVTTAEDSPAVPERAPGQEETWYDEFGREVSEGEALTRTLEDKNGRVVCTYVNRNQAVTSLRYSPKEDTVLPITVFTHEEYQRADRLSRLVTAAYCLLYPLEIAAAGIWYFRRRRREE